MSTQAASPPKARTTKKTFSRSTAIEAEIAASPETIWNLLTDAAGYKRWNSTIVSITGDIAPGGKIELVSTLDPKRTFKLRVKEMDPPSRLVWGDAMGTRVYAVRESDGGSHFEMSEKIGGPLFPLFARMIPPFDEAFEQFLANLKAEAEK